MELDPKLELGVGVWSSGRANAISISAVARGKREGRVEVETDKWLQVEVCFPFAQAQGSLFAALRLQNKPKCQPRHQACK